MENEWPCQEGKLERDKRQRNSKYFVLFVLIKCRLVYISRLFWAVNWEPTGCGQRRSRARFTRKDLFVLLFFQHFGLSVGSSDQWSVLLGQGLFSLVYIGVLVLWRIVNQIEKSSKVCYLTLFAVDWWKWAVLISLQCSTLYTNGKWRNDYCHWWYIEIYSNSAIRHAIDHNYDWVVFVSVSLTAFGHWVVNLNWSSGGSYVYAHSCSHQRPYWEWMWASNWHAIFVIRDTLVFH